MICRNLLHDKIKKHTAMKKIFLSLLLALATLPITAQEPASPAASTVAEPPFENTLVLSDNAAYRLYPTRNISTFIKLDTRDGRMWQVHVGSNIEIPLNPISYAEGYGEPHIGRFALYPTRNFWTFVLLDCDNGGTWQVQWSFEEGDRFVIPINSEGSELDKAK